MAEDPIPLDADDSDDPRLTNPAAARRPEDEDEIDLTEETPADADPDVTSANLHLGSSTLDNASLAAEDRSAAPGADAVNPAATGTLAQGIGSETNSLAAGSRLAGDLAGDAPDTGFGAFAGSPVEISGIPIGVVPPASPSPSPGTAGTADTVDPATARAPRSALEANVGGLDSLLTGAAGDVGAITDSPSVITDSEAGPAAATPDAFAGTGDTGTDTGGQQAGGGDTTPPDGTVGTGDTGTDTGGQQAGGGDTTPPDGTGGIGGTGTDTGTDTGGQQAGGGDTTPPDGTGNTGTDTGGQQAGGGDATPPAGTDGTGGTGAGAGGQVGGDAPGGGDGKIKGTSDDDTLHGGDGDDRIYGISGDDTLYGGAGDDTLDGSAHNDTLYGEAGDDTLDGGAHDDVLYGGTGDDTLYGGSGDDVIDGGADDDVATGGQGDDMFIFGLGGGNDSFDGGNGSWTDTVRLTDADGGSVSSDDWNLVLDQGSVEVDADSYVQLSNDAAGTITFTDGSTLTFEGVERIEW